MSNLNLTMMAAITSVNLAASTTMSAAIALSPNGHMRIAEVPEKAPSKARIKAKSARKARKRNRK